MRALLAGLLLAVPTVLSGPSEVDLRSAYEVLATGRAVSR